MQKEEIKIWWEGPFTIDDITNENIDELQKVIVKVYIKYMAHILYMAMMY